MKKSRGLLVGHVRILGSLIAWVFAFTSGPGRSVAADLTNRYVIKNNAGSAVPYDAWGNAASNIQTAIDYAYAGETVLVAAATYNMGGVTNYPTGSILTNRVSIWKAITVRSKDNDPTNTIIKGRFDTGEPGVVGFVTNGPAAVRCVYMTNGSALIGFTLTNGATLQANYCTPGIDGTNGGGICCQSTAAMISNCLIVGNGAIYYGAGVYQGTLYNCTLSSNVTPYRGGGEAYSTCSNCTFIGNSAQYGGAGYYGTLYNCTLSGNYAGYGGGAYAVTMYNSTIVSNSSGQGGGVRECVCYNCLFTGNRSTSLGGAAYQSRMFNCTVVGNSAATSGGGVQSNRVTYNCVIYFNTATTAGSSNWYQMETLSVSNSCTAPMPTLGVGNIADDPQFVDTNTANYRLGARSPCLNGGTNGSWTTSYPYDLDGRARIRYGTVDMGAYERLHKGTICGVH